MTVWSLETTVFSVRSLLPASSLGFCLKKVIACPDSCYVIDCRIFHLFAFLIKGLLLKYTSGSSDSSAMTSIFQWVLKHLAVLKEIFELFTHQNSPDAVDSSHIINKYNRLSSICSHTVHTHALWRYVSNHVVCVKSWSVPSLLHTVLFFFWSLIFVLSLNSPLFQDFIVYVLANSKLFFLYFEAPVFCGLHLHDFLMKGDFLDWGKNLSWIHHSFLWSSRSSGVSELSSVFFRFKNVVDLTSPNVFAVSLMVLFRFFCLMTHFTASDGSMDFILRNKELDNGGADTQNETKCKQKTHGTKKSRRDPDKVK